MWSSGSTSSMLGSAPSWTRPPSTVTGSPGSRRWWWRSPVCFSVGSACGCAAWSSPRPCMRGCPAGRCCSRSPSRRGLAGPRAHPGRSGGLARRVRRQPAAGGSVGGPDGRGRGVRRRRHADRCPHRPRPDPGRASLPLLQEPLRLVFSGTPFFRNHGDLTNRRRHVSPCDRGEPQHDSFNLMYRTAWWSVLRTGCDVAGPGGVGPTKGSR